MNKKNDYDAIIIGAGAGGLSVGLSLARSGWKVLIAEKNEQPGGNCTAKNYDGYTFDLAVHQLSGISGTGACAGIMREYGINERVDFKRVDPFLVINMPDRSYKLCGDKKDLREELIKDFPNDKKEIDSMFSGLDSLKKDVLLSQRLLYGNNQAINEMIKKEVGLWKIVTFPFTALWGIALQMNSDADRFLRRWISNPKLRSVIHASWVYLGLPPEKLSGLMMNIFVSMQHSSHSYYPLGGSQKMAEAMTEVFIEHGGEILLNAPVKKILIENKRAKGVMLEDGRELCSDVIISNADMPYTYDRLIGKDFVPAKFKKRLENMSLSMGPFKVYLGLDCNVADKGMKHHEYMIFPGYDHNATYDSMRRGIINALSVYSPTKLSPDLAPKGHSTLILTTMVSWQTERDWRTHKETIAEEMISIVEERLLPGLSKHIVVKRILTPEDLRDITNSSEGSMYGWANTPNQTLLRRIGMVSPIRGLYHVGHWTVPGTGVTSAIISGWILGKKIKTRISRFLDKMKT